MRIILLNGPPSCGKDTVAKALGQKLTEQKIDYCVLRMSRPIKRAFAGLVDAEIDSWGNVEDWESTKDLPSELLNGKSYRQWQIDFSEKFMKPLYGEDIFARIFVHTIEHLRTGELGEWNGYVIVPDCGFQIEAETLAALLPEVRKMFVRIHRKGTDFSKDSRSYFHPQEIPLQIDLYNNGTMEDLELNAHELISRKVWSGFAG